MYTNFADRILEIRETEIEQFKAFHLLGYCAALEDGTERLS
jgi:hypothetical protein